MLSADFEIPGIKPSMNVIIRVEMKMYVEFRFIFVMSCIISKSRILCETYFLVNSVVLFRAIIFEL